MTPCYNPRIGPNAIRPYDVRIRFNNLRVKSGVKTTRTKSLGDKNRQIPYSKVKSSGLIEHADKKLIDFFFFFNSSLPILGKKFFSLALLRS